MVVDAVIVVDVVLETEHSQSNCVHTALIIRHQSDAKKKSCLIDRERNVIWGNNLAR